MKKLFYFIFIMLFSEAYSQGTLYLHNYSNYDIQGRLYSRGNTGCLPEVGTSYEFPANLQTEIKSYNESLPIIDKWSVRTTPTGSISTQYPPNSGLLNVMSSLTRWQFSWFLTKDNTGTPTGDQFLMGDDLFSSPCGTSNVNDYHLGNYSEAFWFYLPSTNETYLIIQ